MYFACVLNISLTLYTFHGFSVSPYKTYKGETFSEKKKNESRHREKWPSSVNRFFKRTHTYTICIPLPSGVKFKRMLFVYDRILGYGSGIWGGGSCTRDTSELIKRIINSLMQCAFELQTSSFRE